MFKFFRKNQKQPQDQTRVDAGLSATRQKLDSRLSDAIAQAERIDDEQLHVKNWIAA
jgi:hypothetical protein